MADLATLKSVVSTATMHYGKKMYDNIFNKSVLLSEIKKAGNQQPVSGGLMIVEDVEMLLNPTVSVRDPRIEIPLAEYDPVRQIGFPWATVDGGIALYDEDKYLNSGPERLFDHAKTLISNTEKAFAQAMATAVFSTGAAVGGAQNILGLRLALLASGATYGSMLNLDGSWSAINRAVDTWWNAQVDTTAAVYDIDGATGLRHFYNLCTRGDQMMQPDLVIMTQDLWEAHAAMLVPQQRFEDPKMAEAGFRNLMFDNARIVWDINCPSGFFFCINTQVMKLRPYSECSQSLITKDWHALENTLGEFKPFVWRGQLTCVAPRYCANVSAKTVS